MIFLQQFCDLFFGHGMVLLKINTAKYSVTIRYKLFLFDCRRNKDEKKCTDDQGSDTGLLHDPYFPN